MVSVYAVCIESGQIEYGDSLPVAFFKSLDNAIKYVSNMYNNACYCDNNVEYGFYDDVDVVKAVRVNESVSEMFEDSSLDDKEVKNSIYYAKTIPSFFKSAYVIKIVFGE